MAKYVPDSDTVMFRDGFRTLSTMTRVGALGLGRAHGGRGRGRGPPGPIARPIHPDFLAIVTYQAHSYALTSKQIINKDTNELKQTNIDIMFKYKEPKDGIQDTVNLRFYFSYNNCRIEYDDLRDLDFFLPSPKTLLTYAEIGHTRDGSLDMQKAQQQIKENVTKKINDEEVRVYVEGIVQHTFEQGYFAFNTIHGLIRDEQWDAAGQETESMLVNIIQYVKQVPAHMFIDLSLQNMGTGVLDIKVDMQRRFISDTETIASSRRTRKP